MEVEILIVGAGPAGLQLGYYLKNLNLEYVIIEASHAPGASFTKFPRHRKLISLNKRFNVFPEKEFNMRHDWNSLLSDDYELVMTDYSKELFPHADDLVRYLSDFAYKYELNIEYNTRVEKIAKKDEKFYVKTNEGEIVAKILFMGTGVCGVDLPTDVEGIELADTYENHSTDVEKYVNKTVLIIGGGNSGFETADHLAAHAGIIHVVERRAVRHAWDTHFVGDLRAVNNNLIDMYQLKSLHATLGDPPSKIVKLPDGTFDVSFVEYAGHVDISVGVVTISRNYDAVIVCTGVKWINLDLYDDSCKPDTHTHGKYPSLTPRWESTNVPNLYFIGGAMQAIDRQAASGFIHGFRYNIRALVPLISEKHYGVPLPSEKLENYTLNSLVAHITDRLTTVASLFQCFGVLCDLVIIDQDKNAHYFEDLPRRYLKECRSNDLLNHPHAFIITFQYGFPRYSKNLSSNLFIQDSGTLNTKCGGFLHPVFEYYSFGKYQEEFHLFETLDIRFNNNYKKNSSLSTLNYQLLLDQFNHFLKLEPNATEEQIKPLRKLTHPDTDVEEKRRIFAKFMPLDEVWSRELTEQWVKLVKAQKEAEQKLIECDLFPLPISKWP